jgi:DNA-binding beta-propeller fold protein YncE
MDKGSKVFAGALAVFIATLSGTQATTVYIPDGTAGEVLVVDGATDAVLGRLTGLPDIHGLGGASGARYLVAGSFAETAVAEAAAVDKPAGVSDDEHAAHHGAAARSASSAGGAVSIITVLDATDGSPVRRLEVPGAVHHVAVSPDGRYAVATHPNADGVSVVDLSTLTVSGLVRTGPAPNYAAFNPDGSLVYVSNSGNGTVSEIETDRWFVRRNLIAGDTPEHIVLAPDGRTLYVANVDAGTVSALAIEQGGIARTFTVGGELHGLDISDDGYTLFVSGKGENKLVAIDLPSGAMRAVPLGPSPYHLAVVRGAGKLYVSSRDEPKIWVIDEGTFTPRGTIALSGEGHQMVVLP